MEIRVLISLSTAHFHVGRFRESETSLRRSLQLQQATGCASQESETMFLLGWNLVHQGRLEEAKACGEHILGTTRSPGRQPLRGLALSVIGGARMVEGEYAGAGQVLHESIEELKAGWQVDWLGRRSAIQSTLACCLAHLQRPDEARSTLVQAGRIALEARSLIAVLMFLPAAALFYLKEGDKRRAGEIHRLAVGHPYAARSRWYDSVVGRHVVPPRSARGPRRSSAGRGSTSPDRLWPAVDRLLEELGRGTAVKRRPTQ